MSRLEGLPDVIARLAAAGVVTVEDVLRESVCVRDLPGRSNHVLRAAGLTIHVKRSKGAGEPREALALERVRSAGVPTATLAFDGVDAELGAITGTLDLAPSEPLDDLLRRGLTPSQRAAAFDTLAGITATLHAAHLHHRDLYLCHVYVRFSGDEAVVALIDLERVGRHRRPLGRRVVKDLAALRSSLPAGSTTSEERRAFLRRYLELRGLDPEHVQGRLLRRIQRKVARIRAHVPRTPVGDAAAPREASE